MALIKKQRGRVTYYTREGNNTFADVVTEELDNGDLRIHFAGKTGRAEAIQDPEREIPSIFESWEECLKEAGICSSLSEVDFLEMHSFGAAPKAPSPIADPQGYAEERQRIRQAYSKAYVQYWKERMPDNGLPVRFTVYLEDLPNSKAAYELAGTALYQRNPKDKA